MKIQTTQTWQIGDSLNLLPTLDNNSIDLTLSSPPYNIGIDYGIYKDNLKYDLYMQNMKEIIELLFLKTKNTGRLVYNVLINAKIDGEMRQPMYDFMTVIKESGFKIFSTPLWYDNTHTVHTAWGSWMSASSPYFYNPHEVLIMAYKGNWKKDKVGKDTVTKEQFLNMNKGMIAFPTERKENHPAPFRVEMAKTIIECLSFEGDMILDPFLGYGTVLEACKIINRNCIGFEISNEWEPYYKKRLNPNSIELTDGKVTAVYENLLKYFE